MTLNPTPDPNAIELITLRKDEYERMVEKIKRYEKAICDVLDEGHSSECGYHSNRNCDCHTKPIRDALYNDNNNN